MPSGWKLKVRVAAQGLTLVSNLHWQEITHQIATENGSYLEFVVGTKHLDSFRTLLLHRPRRVWHDLYWSQLRVSSGGISSMVTVAATSARNDFFCSAKSVSVSLLFTVVTFL